VERSARIVARVRATIGRLSAVNVTALFKQAADERGRGGVAKSVSPPERFFGLVASTLLAQQDREVEGGIRKSSLGGSPISRLGAGNITALLEQHAEVRRRKGMAELVGRAEGRFGLIRLPLLDEREALLQQAVGLPRVVNGKARYVEVAESRAVHGPPLN
jgi:hypothetical protein